MNNSLPQEEITRIEREAYEKLPAYKKRHANENFATDWETGYTAGAIHEAERGRGMAKGFFDWFMDENNPFFWEDGKYLKMIGDDEHRYTTAELLDLYILETLKRKG